MVPLVNNRRLLRHQVPAADPAPLGPHHGLAEQTKLLTACLASGMVSNPWAELGREGTCGAFGYCPCHHDTMIVRSMWLQRSWIHGPCNILPLLLLQ